MSKFEKKRPIKKEDTSDSDSGPDDVKPAKKSKSAAQAPSASGGSSTPGSALPGDEPSWLLGGMKFVKVREFKGKTYIDIREYYSDKKTMDMMPGKKGISLNCEQYQKLKSIISEVDRALP